MSRHRSRFWQETDTLNVSNVIVDVCSLTVVEQGDVGAFPASARVLAEVISLGIWGSTSYVWPGGKARGDLALDG